MTRTLLRIILIWGSLLFINSLAKSQNWNTQSVLAQGKLYKIACSEEGVYRLDYAFLESLGINPTTINPKQIQIFGQGGGALPGPNSAPRIDDLIEVPIKIQGNSENSFQSGDYILFYGEGPDRWIFDEQSMQYVYEKNPYDFHNYYFLRLGVQDGKRIQIAISATNPEYETSLFSEKQHLEEENYNLLHFSNNVNLQGSGRIWLGSLFKTERIQDFTDAFDFTGLDITDPIQVDMKFATRSSKSSKVELMIGDGLLSTSIPRTQVNDVEADYAKEGRIRKSLMINTNSPTITINYPDLGNNNQGWLDYITLNYRKDLIYSGIQTSFSDIKSFQYDRIKYKITTMGKEIEVWDISNSLAPQQIDLIIQPEIAEFVHEKSNQTPHFIAFDINNTFTPEAIGTIENQNLHGILSAEYLLIYHPDFRKAAETIAAHRRNHSGLQVVMASIHEIFNEFSSGRTDPTAIRDFTKLIYDRSSGFLKYLLLLGDGSFDYRHIYDDLNNESFIPVYETKESFNPILSFPSDDYFALLGNNEGGNLVGALDIAVGRIPVRTADEANIVAEKIVHYETKEETLGDWRVNILFVADDEDNNRHINAADGIANGIKSEYPLFNINKVYLDAFEQENRAGGIFNPNAKNAINQNLFKGQLVTNYIGHGGSNGWAQERVLMHEDIDKWNNYDRLSLLVTATCSFAGYDNPRKITAGEYSLTHPDGGSIALFTTVRAVYAISNERLTQRVFDHVFKPVNGQVPPIGQILANSKNSTSADTTGANARKFTLLGDPALRLALPDYKIKTLKINGKDISDAKRDTLKALGKVSIEGEVLDINDQLITDFNGKIYPTIFDKSTLVKTLAQDEDSYEKTFELQKSIIFKGLASVVNGKFSFSFVVPKDINYVFGNGKISYYAEDGSPIDAAGNLLEVVVGGTDPLGVSDNQGPEISILLENEDFVFGGTTNPDPTLIVKLEDENGINVIGNSIGHDLTGVIDQNFQNTIVLNEFYESDLDDYTKGTVHYPLDNLEEGKHTITIKAWDIANNSSESFTEFYIVDDINSGLRHVLNYPNPFNENTCFQFEHPFQNRDLDINVNIYTPSGRLVRSLSESIKASGTLSRDVKWDGRDEFGDPLANGIYIYRIKITSIDLTGNFIEQSSDLEKLVILR